MANGAVIAPPAGLDLRYAFDRRLGAKGAFRDLATGRVVPWEQVRGALDHVIRGAEESLLRQAQRLREGQIPLEVFQRQMERDVKALNLAAYCVERGGWQQMTQSDFGRVGRILYNPNGRAEDGTWGQYQYLNRLIGQIERGEQRLDGWLDQRLRLFARNSRAVYQEAERRRLRDLGFSEARSIRHVSDSCSAADGPRPGCIEEEAAGWQDIDEITPVGKRNCHNNCKCSFEYRNPTTGEIWRP